MLFDQPGVGVEKLIPFGVTGQYWMSRIDSKLGDRMEELLRLGNLDTVREHRIHRRLAKYHIHQLWWNTL
jgi:hypothetical protein